MKNPIFVFNVRKSNNLYQRKIRSHNEVKTFLNKHFLCENVCLFSNYFNPLSAVKIHVQTKRGYEAALFIRSKKE